MPTAATTADAAPSSDPTVAATTLTATTDSVTTTSTLTTDTLAAPTMSVSGQTVSWTPTQGVTSYVFARKIPGQATQYSIVNGTSTTPPAVPGTTVNYGVRTNVTGSYWAERGLHHLPARSRLTRSRRRRCRCPDKRSAGRRRGRHVVCVRAQDPGQATQYSIVNGTSTTPPAVSWHDRQLRRAHQRHRQLLGQRGLDHLPGEQSLAVALAVARRAVDGPFQMGIVSGSALSWELQFIAALGAHTARLEFGIGTSASNMASVIDAYARAGVRPLLLASFYGRTPDDVGVAEPRQLGGGVRARRHVLGGQDATPPNTAVTDDRVRQRDELQLPVLRQLAEHVRRARAGVCAAGTDGGRRDRSGEPEVGLLVQGDNASSAPHG